VLKISPFCLIEIALYDFYYSNSELKSSDQHKSSFESIYKGSLEGVVCTKTPGLDIVRLIGYTQSYNDS